MILGPVRRGGPLTLGVRAIRKTLRPLTEPVCRTARQQSGSEEGLGQDRARPRHRGDAEIGTQSQRLTATVTATAATNGYQQRPAAAHHSRTIHASWGYVRHSLADSRSTAPPHREPGLRTSGACPEMSWPNRQPTQPRNRLPSTCIKGSDVGLCTAGLCVMT